jgi:hypothetical protein
MPCGALPLTEPGSGKIGVLGKSRFFCLMTNAQLRDSAGAKKPLFCSNLTKQGILFVNNSTPPGENTLADCPCKTSEKMS